MARCYYRRCRYNNSDFPSVRVCVICVVPVYVIVAYVYGMYLRDHGILPMAIWRCPELFLCSIRVICSYREFEE